VAEKGSLALPSDRAFRGFTELGLVQNESLVEEPKDDDDIHGDSCPAVIRNPDCEDNIKWIQKRSYYSTD
jgi:hypothetical protein